MLLRHSHHYLQQLTTIHSYSSPPHLHEQQRAITDISNSRAVTTHARVCTRTHTLSTILGGAQNFLTPHVHHIPKTLSHVNKQHMSRTETSGRPNKECHNAFLPPLTLPFTRDGIRCQSSISAILICGGGSRCRSSGTPDGTVSCMRCSATAGYQLPIIHLVLRVGKWDVKCVCHINGKHVQL